MPVSSPLSAFHTILASWFAASFGEPTDVQKQAWEAIAPGQHTLIAAPTGSGKTLAALLPCMDRAIRSAMSGRRPEAGVQTLYVTPLKALNNDVHHHVIRFAEAIGQAADEGGYADWPGLRAAVRTGDTTSAQRAAMLRRPPDILITTPESLFILLTSAKGRHMLRGVEQVIVDEIHDLAADKRGAHLSLSLERLAALCGRPVQRIGVSATQKPIERIAHYLAGWEEPAGDAFSLQPLASPADPYAQDLAEHPLGYKPRPVTIVQSRMVKQFELQVTMPDAEKRGQGHSKETVWFPLLDRLIQLMGDSRSVLIFTNSRRLCERLCLRLNDYTGHEIAKAHHGSLSRERRLEVEAQLKSGELRVLIATSSLELGIDVGHIDLVLQVDSPLDSASGIQRIGRAGHAVGDVSRGVILARSRGMLPEIAVLARRIGSRDIEPINLPRNPLDVLSQHTVAMAAAEEHTLDGLYRLVCRSDSFRTFPHERLAAMLQVLGGRYPFVKPLLYYDAATGQISKRANSSMAAFTGAGTIPSSSAFPVHHAGSRSHLGELDEEFIHESRVGDVFQLGTSSWMIQEIRKDRVYVTEAGNRYSEIPFWRGEGSGRSYENGQLIGQLWEEIADRLEAGPASAEADLSTAEWLRRFCHFDGHAADALISYVRAQMAVSEIPSHKRLVVEYYQDLTNRTHVILHNHWGRRVNRTWLLAIEKQFQEILPYRLYGNAKDSGIEFVLPDWDPSWLQAIWKVTPDALEPLLSEAVTGSPLLAIAFRRLAETSLLLSRSFTRTPMWQKRMRSEELLKDSLPFAAEFPYLHEAVRECLHHYLDLNQLKEALRDIQQGRMEITVRETRHPSPLAAQFIADYVNMQLYEGDSLNDAIQLQLLHISKELTAEMFGQDAVRRAISESVLQQEQERLSMLPHQLKDEADCYQLLKQRGDSSTEELIRLGGEPVHAWLAVLEGRGRIMQMPFGSSTRWICADEADLYRKFPHSQASIAFIAGRYADRVLSFTEEDLQMSYPMLDAGQASGVIEELLRQERIEQAPFASSPDERLWMSSRTASRMIRLSIREARQEAEPADAAEWLIRAASLQHVLPAAQVRGSEGLRSVIAKLQGFFLPVGLWESVIFPARIPDYRKDDLDLLCASGEVIWIGRREDGSKEGKVAFFLTESKPLYAPFLKQAAGAGTKHPELLTLVRRTGASFLTRLSREAGQLPSELLEQLLDLVWEGHVSNDQFAPLRIQVKTKGKLLAKTGSGQGRWYPVSTLEETFTADPPKALPLEPGNLIEDAALPADTHHTGDHSPRNLTLPEPSAMAWTRHLLDSHGIITHELVSHACPFSWDALLPVMKQLEEWGVMTRGLFIRGVPAMQFISRELAPKLHPVPEASGTGSVTILSAVDPANLFGLVTPWPESRGPAFARKPGNYIVLDNSGQWLLWIEGGGRKVHWLIDPVEAAGDPADILRTVFQAMMRLQAVSKIKVSSWNGAPVTHSEGEPVLRTLGAERDKDSLVLWRSQLAP
ncbi:DEAD/DEAH box helicase [Paenibacillus sambharensis]|uniref:DEAD/DEAH box helicase n=1 Tax=Paenibacillus sambharensis TaxID=1803190 RepID=A0A2W1LED5_9BACL|nr:DEAD/DEAH box helicase [Paenibacillus sambharensis]PZD96450.1 DEAD/DEAH box helicase [Paenibacillus sambharensis]